MSNLIPPHGGKGLTCCLLEGDELEAEKKKAEGLKRISVSPREKGDLIMMGIGGFSPLTGFMTKADWKNVCDNFQLTVSKLEIIANIFPVGLGHKTSQRTKATNSHHNQVALFTRGKRNPF